MAQRQRATNSQMRCRNTKVRTANKAEGKSMHTPPIKVRMDDETRKKLEDQCRTAGMDRSKYIRHLLNKPRAFTQKSGHRQIVLMTRIANDLDGIARWVQEEHEHVDAQMVILHLLRIERHIWSECMHGGPQL